MKIDIIGGGIGGLTTAIALQQKGHTIRVFEQTEELKPVGAGIILANNAMQVYRKLGLAPCIEEEGQHISSINITNSQLTPIAKTKLNYFEKKYNAKNIAIHRAKLQEILLKHFGKNNLYLNYKLQKIERISNSYQLTFDNNTKIISEFVIAADGINSTVRKLLFKNFNIRNAKQICWRGVANYTLPKNLNNELNEVWAKRERFGIVPLKNNKVYWYLVKKNHNNYIELPFKKVVKSIKNLHPVIYELLNNTSISNIHKSEMSDIKPNNEPWFQKNIVLLGDAAHATTPNMGQGACQAIEDAYILSEILNTYGFEEGLLKYKSIRAKKVKNIVNTSWILGKIAHLPYPFNIILRDTLLRISPKSINRKQTEHIFKLDKI